uniref:Hypothetical secreted protein n=1 Tax=Simulium guianense TaxID=445764 RepID=F5GTV5_SIMGU
MIAIGTIQLALLAVLAIAVVQTRDSVYAPPIWEYARNGQERHLYLNTYHYCNYTKTAMKGPLMINIKGSTYNSPNVVLDGKGKHLGCGKITVKGSDITEPVVCANFRRNWTEGLCRVHSASVEYTFEIFENKHVYNRN